MKVGWLYVGSWALMIACYLLQESRARSWKRLALETKANADQWTERALTAARSLNKAMIVEVPRQAAIMAGLMQEVAAVDGAEGLTMGFWNGADGDQPELDGVATAGWYGSLHVHGQELRAEGMANPLGALAALLAKARGAEDICMQCGRPVGADAGMCAVLAGTDADGNLLVGTECNPPPGAEGEGP